MSKVAELIAAVDAVVGCDPAHLGDGETVVELHRQLERLQAVTTRAAAAFDARREWEADGARSGAAWLAVRCHAPVSAARRRVHLGRALRHLAAVESAWLAGDVGEPHVALLASARTPATEAALARDEEALVGQARTLRYRDFGRAMAYWRQLADEEGTEADAGAQHSARRLHCSQTFGGSWVLDGLLDPMSGAVVAQALEGIEHELFEADWAEARQRVGEGVSRADLGRTPAQRRTDALVAMARRAGAVAPGSRLPEPLFTVLVDYPTFTRVCELADGTVVTPGSLVRWLGEGWVERVVFDGPDRVKNVGTRRRIFTGATRRAVEVRDRECYHEFCDLPADRCQIDHRQPWAWGGPTTDDNGRPACAFHNRLRNKPDQGAQPP